MDTIQLTQDVHLKSKNPYRKEFILNNNLVPEETYPLLISYLTWLRNVNGNPSRVDINHQNEQENSEFKFLCSHSLLFFLTATKQFEVITKLFCIPSFTTQLQHVITMINKEHYNEKQVKKKRLLHLIQQQENKLRFQLNRKSNSILSLNQQPTFFASTSECNEERKLPSSANMYFFSAIKPCSQVSI